MDALTRAYQAGKRFGDFFNHRYFALDEEGRRLWDEKRLFHHGALGQAIAVGSAAALTFTDSPRLQRALETSAAVGLGLMDSDEHDRDRWWTEGRITLASIAMFAPIISRVKQD
ncbi:MAG TPA: hypothetical protein VNZ52_06075 [Candidatus Thermoplasmatota archaeon]|nr:hypothetical protein [Candidatus Thermoplasmatota archaeon]